MGKVVYDYDKMDKDFWQQFSEMSDIFHDNEELKNMQIRNKHDLNEFWTQIRNVIKRTARDCIEHHKTTVQHRDMDPKQLCDTFADIKQINKIIIQYNPKNWSRNQQELIHRWDRTYNNISYQMTKYKHQNTLPRTIDNDNIVQTRKIIKDF